MTCGTVTRTGGAATAAGCDSGTTSGATGSGPAADLVPAPFAELNASSDVGAMLAALIVKAARDQRNLAQETRTAAESAQRAADDQQLAAMKEEASDKLTAGLITAGTQIASGAMTMGTADAEEETATSWQAAGKMTEASGKAHATLVTYDADMAAKDAKQAEQISGREKRTVDDARDLDKDAKEMLNRALSYYKEYLTAKADTQRATLLKA